MPEGKERVREDSVDLVTHPNVFSACDEPWSCQPLSIVVFGASGDLAKKKTFPALFDLYVDGRIGASTVIVGYARSALSEEEFRQRLRPFLLKHGKEQDVDDFLHVCRYRHGQYDSDEDIAAVCKELPSLHRISAGDLENRVFYFALPPSVFPFVARSVSKVGHTEKGWLRVVVEKPFGKDTQSARDLLKVLNATFTEKEIYRIDHYLGKEMIANMITLRFGNTFLEPLFNRNFVQCVIVTFKESFGTMGRGGYFDNYGIIRDVMQNHLMQVLSIVAMEPPVRVAGPDYSEYVRNEKVKLLDCIKPWTLDNMVLGQYVGNGTEPGYLEDETVPKGSTQATYCSVAMEIDNPRWEGVPFIMKAGKALDSSKAEIRIQLKRPAGSCAMFNGQEIPCNELVIALQPDPSIYMKTNVKQPGLHTVVTQSELDLDYRNRYKDVQMYDAYTRLILDVLRGKQATFVRDDELLAAWKICTPVLHKIENEKIKPIPYKYGSRGPPESDELIKKRGYIRNPNYADNWRAAAGK
uniref:Glucose-6-phosphate 1-dehydrogenase n=1 Tax=Mucochytrium quahogii TaxID=96639 RepID=A0A7S2W462_9STRA|mmetsp:Transcript_34118/g.54630  ORF Transcript_34118/g.54630 Transcript_34118/m.54630 type:complete len:524 (-) Transcript_34118:1576-3147(-)|eukprot:CAMPEP_0203752684 /NCGR_PEP_ID=MMETSP0098-20131031/6565_1 /ASSEMBLY_ACC=CAM_ASM_000208 /TAXON_ID=96639 /ORGANISM=" , Strain NY0313808BC1" /LENGTH=523 /DNA_ID=CAMNT_0050642957 /DNA_START=98 /DNA_END=1669 /DNA_ORIENTATION=+